MSLSEWPKPGASIGGGWVADEAWAIDLAGVQNAAVTTYTSSYTNRATSHAIGDTMSANISEERITGFNGQKHIVSHTVDAKIASVGLGYGDDPSAYVRETTEYALEYLIWCGLSLKADATRSFAETLKFTLTADVQNVLFDVTSEQETETIEINAGDVTAKAEAMASRQAARGPSR